jgi:hypothetical protein
MRRSQHTGQDILALFFFFFLSFYGIACSLNGFLLPQKGQQKSFAKRPPAGAVPRFPQGGSDLKGNLIYSI